MITRTNSSTVTYVWSANEKQMYDSTDFVAVRIRVAKKNRFFKKPNLVGLLGFIAFWFFSFNLFLSKKRTWFLDCCGFLFGWFMWDSVCCSQHRICQYLHICIVQMFQNLNHNKTLHYSWNIGLWMKFWVVFWVGLSQKPLFLGIRSESCSLVRVYRWKFSWGEGWTR